MRTVALAHTHREKEALRANAAFCGIGLCLCCCALCLRLCRLAGHRPAGFARSMRGKCRATLTLPYSPLSAFLCSLMCMCMLCLCTTAHVSVRLYVCAIVYGCVLFYMLNICGTPPAFERLCGRGGRGQSVFARLG